MHPLKIAGSLSVGRGLHHLEMADLQIAISAFGIDKPAFPADGPGLISQCNWDPKVESELKRWPQGTGMIDGFQGGEEVENSAMVGFIYGGS